MRGVPRPERVQNTYGDNGNVRVHKDRHKKMTRNRISLIFSDGFNRVSYTESAAYHQLCLLLPKLC